MTRRTKTIIVLAFEALLLIAMFGSFACFVRDSHDFLEGVPLGIDQPRRE